MNPERIKHIEMAKPAVPAEAPIRRSRPLIPPRPGTVPSPERELPKVPIPAVPNAPERRREKVPA